MKIQCLIRRAQGSQVSFDANDKWPAGHYHFKPESDAPGAPHVAEVTEEMHLHRLLSQPDVYRVVPDGQAKADVPASGGVVIPPKQPPAPPAAPPAGPPAGDTTTAPPPPPAADVDAKVVDEIRDLTVRELKAKVNTYDAAALRAALAIERDRKDDKPRTSWIAVVEAHLGAEG
ncbi:hypothetical protein [Luteimonas saliphila]|uniref:hypothetical protein n=1 Tax=Luteimonas saliphila TaxID=2804919 RepID=UPI00192D567B|nr:hypothetical protein [Luteimonas saliphila]